jgi:hypothetical protein
MGELVVYVLTRFRSWEWWFVFVVIWAERTVLVMICIWEEWKGGRRDEANFCVFFTLSDVSGPTKSRLYAPSHPPPHPGKGNFHADWPHLTDVPCVWIVLLRRKHGPSLDVEWWCVKYISISHLRSLRSLVLFRVHMQSLTTSFTGVSGLFPCCQVIHWHCVWYKVLRPEDARNQCLCPFLYHQSPTLRPHSPTARLDECSSALYPSCLEHIH